MDEIEVVASRVDLRDGTEIERTVRFVGELLATYVLTLRKETLYRWEAGGFLVYTYVKPPVGLRRSYLSHDVDRARGYTAEEVAHRHPELATALGITSAHDGIQGTLTVHRTCSDTQPP